MTTPAALLHCPCRLPSHPPHWLMVFLPDWESGAVCRQPSGAVPICCDGVKSAEGDGGHRATLPHPHTQPMQQAASAAV